MSVESEARNQDTSTEPSSAQALNSSHTQDASRERRRTSAEHVYFQKNYYEICINVRRQIKPTQKPYKNI